MTNEINSDNRRRELAELERLRTKAASSARRRRLEETGDPLTQKERAAHELRQQEAAEAAKPVFALLAVARMKPQQRKRK